MALCAVVPDLSCDVGTLVDLKVDLQLINHEPSARQFTRLSQWCCYVISKFTEQGLHLQGERAQLTLHVFDIELLLDLLRNPAYKAQQVFEKLVAGNMVTGVQVGAFYALPLAAVTLTLW